MASSITPPIPSTSQTGGAKRNSYRIHKSTIYKNPPGSRKNPNSLRFILAIIINIRHGGKQKTAAKAFRLSSGKYLGPGSATDHRLMNDKALAGILNDTDIAHYWHLESVAENLGIPTGALLIVSRLYSIISKSEPGLTKDFITSMRSFVDCLESMAETGDLTEDHLNAFIKSFEATHTAERVQPRLID